MGASAKNVLYFAPHRMAGSGEQDMRYRLHLGTDNTDVEHVGDGGKARDAWSYCRQAGPNRDNTFDTKMIDAFGSQYVGLTGDWRNELWDYCKAYNVP